MGRNGESSSILLDAQEQIPQIALGSFSVSHHFIQDSGIARDVKGRSMPPA
jgi:hypothetical protein